MKKILIALTSLLFCVQLFAGESIVTVTPGQPLPFGGSGDFKANGSVPMTGELSVPSIKVGTNAAITNFQDVFIADRIPIGTILSYSSVTAPAGYFLCDGSAVSRSTYSNLFSVISTNYGSGNGSTTFTLPDLRNRFAYGVSGGLGVTGGVSSVTLTTNQIPAHAHDLGGASIYSFQGGSGGTGIGGGSWAGVNNSLTVASTGNGLPHTNMPPYQTVCYIIKHSDVLLTTANNVLRTDGTIPMTGTLETPSIKITTGATNGATLMATNSTGQAVWDYKPTAIAWPTNATPCPANVYTIIPMQVGTFSGTSLSGNGILLNKIGWWHLSARITARGAHVAGQLLGYLRVNDTAIDRSFDNNTTGNDLPGMNIHYYNENVTNVTTIVQGYYQSLTNEPLPLYTRISVHYLGP